MTVLSILQKLSRYGVGVIFIIAGVLKSFDPHAFSLQLEPYGFIFRSFAVEIAYLVIIAEILLGLSLTLFLLPRFVIPSLAILTIIFIGLSLWGWQQGLEKGCGCFGAVLDRTPAQVIIEDIILLTALGLCWREYKYSFPHSENRKKYVFGIGIFAALILMTTADDLPVDSLVTRLRAGAELKDIAVSDISEDLSHGLFLVVLVGDECPRCADTVDRLNSYGEIENFPDVVGVFAGTKERSVAFFWENLPGFSLGYAPYIIIRSYFRKLPRIFLMNDGIVRYVWNEELPPAGEIVARTGEVR